MRHKLLLVGEAPGRESIRERPSLALTGPSGKNICSLAGWEWECFLRWTERMNLFLDPQPTWHPRWARESAIEMMPLFRNRRVVLFGAKVAEAFALSSQPHYEWMEFQGNAAVALVPHPSGRNRAWNDAEERARAHDFLGGLLEC